MAKKKEARGVEERFKEVYDHFILDPLKRTSSRKPWKPSGLTFFDKGIGYCLKNKCDLIHFLPVVGEESGEEVYLLGELSLGYNPGNFHDGTYDGDDPHLFLKDNRPMICRASPLRVLEIIHSSLHSRQDALVLYSCFYDLDRWGLENFGVNRPGVEETYRGVLEESVEMRKQREDFKRRLGKISQLSRL